MSTFEGIGINTPDAQLLNTTTTLGSSFSKTVVGTTISFRATTSNSLFFGSAPLFATLTVVGRDSGARVQIPIEITKIS
jgi:hypothetical protein